MKRLKIESIEFLDVLAQGGQAIIYSGALFSREGNQSVALKVYKVSDQSDSFEQEKYILSHAHHPALVKAHGYFVSDRGNGFALEFLRGRTLAEAMFANNVCLSGKSLRYLARELLDGLSYLHALPYSFELIHGDLSADNIFLTSAGEIKIIDFGAVVQSDGMWGKRRYFAPEQLNGQRANRLSDLYAFGCVIFEASLVRGFDPSYFAREFIDLKRKLGEDEEDLFFVIRACLSPSVIFRPRSARHAKDALPRLSDVERSVAQREISSLAEQK